MKEGAMRGNILKIRATTHIDVPASICYETELSGKALGCYVKILSLPNNFHFSIKNFATLFKEGRESIRAGIKELESFGYIVRAQRRWGNGKYANDTLWIALDEPGLQQELVDFLAERHYEIVSTVERETQSTELHLDLSAARQWLDAEEAMRRAEANEDGRRIFRAEGWEELRRVKQMDTQDAIFHQQQSPRSEPMPENPSSVATCALWTNVDNMGKPKNVENSDNHSVMWKTQQNPRSEPMPRNWASVATCENIENDPQNPRSEPMPKKPMPENPSQYNLLNVLTFSTSNSSKPTTRTTSDSQVVGRASEKTEQHHSPATRKPEPQTFGAARDSAELDSRSSRTEPVDGQVQLDDVYAQNAISATELFGKKRVQANLGRNKPSKSQTTGLSSKETENTRQNARGKP